MQLFHLTERTFDYPYSVKHYQFEKIPNFSKKDLLKAGSLEIRSKNSQKYALTCRLNKFDLNPAQDIALYHPILHSVAYNILRCKQDAEDIVQDTFLKWLSIDRTKIQNTKAYLITAVTNNCLNHLNTLRRKKEEYWDSSKLSQLIVKFKESDFAHLDLEAELSAAFKVLLTKLEPLERAAYLLKEVFDFDYDALQQVLNKKTDHCRQLFRSE